MEPEKFPASTMFPSRSTPTALPCCSSASPKLFAHRDAPDAEYFATQTSSIPALVSDRPLRSAVLRKCPVTTTLPVPSTATAAASSSPEPPPCRAHRYAPVAPEYFATNMSSGATGAYLWARQGGG